MELYVLIVWVGEFLIPKRKPANVLKEQFGMDMAVLKSNFVRMENNGTFSNICVNVPSIPIGMEHIVSGGSRVRTE